MTGIHAIGGSGRQAPAFFNAGTGGVESPVSGTLQVPYPGSIIAGSLLILSMHVNDSGAPAITAPAGWSAVPSATGVSADTLCQCTAYYKVSSGSESGNLDVTCTANLVAAGQIYQFVNANSVEGGAGAVNQASGATINQTSVTTSGAKRLALNLISAEVNTTIGDFTTETGGDFTEATPEFTSATGPILMQLQTAFIPTATTISGGSVNMGAAGTYRGRLGLAIYYA